MPEGHLTRALKGKISIRYSHSKSPVLILGPILSEGHHHYRRSRNIKVVFTSFTEIVMIRSLFGSKIALHFEGTCSLGVSETFGGVALNSAPYSRTENGDSLGNLNSGL